MVFDISMTILFRIELWSISWQFFHVDFRMSDQISLRRAALMSTCSIPDQYDLARHITLQMLECYDHLFTLDGTFKMTLENLARHRQSHCSRQNSPIPCHSPQDGSFASSCPSRCQWFQIREAKFIEEHDDCAETQRLFLSLANPLPARPSLVLHLARRHVAMASEHCNLTDPTLAQERLDDSLCQIPS
jgi:hypothetical protein